MTLPRYVVILIAAALSHASTLAGVIVGTGHPDNAHLGASKAVRLVLSPASVGHILLLPYFNLQVGNATLFSVTNHDTHNGKVLKLRLRGGANGDALLDMVVLLAPGDTWTALLRAGASGIGEVVTEDSSCTVPRLVPGQAQAFSTRRLPADTSEQQVANTREGYAEVIAMADLPPNAVYGTSGNRISALFAHITGATPLCGATAIDPALVQTDFTDEAAAALLGLAAPTSGLSGRWTLINVPRTTTFSGILPALVAVDAAGATARANFVLFPPVADAYPGSADQVTADPLLRSEAYGVKSSDGTAAQRFTSPAITAAHVDLPDLSTPYTLPPGSPQAPLRQATEATAALAAHLLRNDYAIDALIDAKTDWTFSMPMRRYGVAMDYAATPGRRRYAMVPASGPQYFHDANTVTNPSNGHQVCYDFPSADFYSRAGTSKNFVGADPFQTRLCGATTVMSFADVGSSVLSASLARTDTYSRSFVNGWAELRLQDARTGLGAPVLGHAFIRAVNPAATPGVSGTYGISYEHQLHR